MLREKRIGNGGGCPMAKGEGISGESILYMVDRFTDDMLKLKCIGQVPQYQHKEHCQNLIKMPVGFDGLSLVQGIYERVESNWNKARNHNPSTPFSLTF